MQRRHFLLVGAGAAGALLVGWSLSAPRQRLLAGTPLSVRAGESALNGWVKVGADDSVTVMMSQAEMGQGAHTGLAMLLADEMDADWDRIRLEQSSLDTLYNNQASIVDSLPFRPDDHGALRWAVERVAHNVLRSIPGLIGTGGSSSIKDQFMPLRQAGASARAMLLAAAAEAWRVPMAECTARSGLIQHPSGRSARYGELAAAAGRQPVPAAVALKSRGEFRLIGKATRRLDSGPKIDGSARFGIDARPPGLLYADIVMCPTVGGRVAQVRDAAARAVSGVRDVVVLPPVGGVVAGAGETAGGVAVIAESRHAALKGVRALEVTWHAGAADSVSSRDIETALTSPPGGGHETVHFERGDVAAALATAASTVSADYFVPFVAHAPMEPMNCTVQFAGGRATVWAGTQAPGFARRAVAKALGVAADRVEVVVPYLGGGFGRRYFTDVIVQTALLARGTNGAPVQLLWSRPQDTTHDYYRPAFASRHQAGFDAAGNLIAWQATSSGSSLGAPSFMDASTDGASNTGYAFPTARIAHRRMESALTVGIWRSVNHSQNAFFTESFVDECAAAAQRDPVALRRELLRHDPRARAVLERAAELADWGGPPVAAADGVRRGRGIALHRCFGSVVAQVATVAVDADRRIRVERVVCVVDCGLAVNPNTVRQQMEGAIVYGLSAALRNEISIERGQVQQRNFDDGLALRMDECPRIDTQLIDSDAAPGGVGEAGLPPIAPAVANAVYAATGIRLRRLPLRLV